MNILNASSFPLNCKVRQSHPAAKRQRGFFFHFYPSLSERKPKSVKIPSCHLENTRFKSGASFHPSTEKLVGKVVHLNISADSETFIQVA